MTTNSGSSPNGGPQGGLPSWVYLVVLASLALAILAGAAGFVYYLKSGRMQAERDADRERIAKAEAARAAEALKHSESTRLQENAIGDAAATTNSLGQLLASGHTLRTMVRDLLTNDVGKAMAVHTDLVEKFASILDYQLPALPQEVEVRTKLEGGRRFILSLQSARGTTATPSADLVKAIHDDRAWSDARAKLVADAQAAVDGIVTEAKSKLSPAAGPATPTLESAIKSLRTSRATVSSEVVKQAAQEARDKATQDLAKEQREQIAAEGEKMKQELAEQKSKLLAEIAEMKAQAKRDEDARAAAEAQVIAKAKVDNENAILEAKKVGLRQKAQSPEVAAKLAPFTTPGVWNLGKMAVSAEKKPLSLSALQRYGALSPTTEGLRKLVFVAHDHRDKDRPRWPFSPVQYDDKPASRELVTQTQQLLIELAPVLVELKMLEP